MKIREIKNNVPSMTARSSYQVLVQKTYGIEETQRSPKQDQGVTKVFGSDHVLKPTQWRKGSHEIITIGVRKSDYSLGTSGLNE